MPANISPLAQTFKVPESFVQGCFITSVDLYFANKAVGETAPVEVQIVETLNGYPTQNVVENAKAIMYPANITASSNSTVSTKFKFQRLVKLEPNTEYAIKVLSNSLKYKVWTAVIGERRVDNPAILISQQPALGSLFKSQNNSTWTPEQLQDLTFVLNRAKFNTGVVGNVSLVEAPLSEYINLPPNPFKITNTKNKVKVHHPNHGLNAGMFVTYQNSSDTQFNATFTITKVVNSDYYIITTSANQTATNFVGGNGVITEKTVKFDTLNVYGVYEGKSSGLKITTRLASDTAVDSSDTDVVASQFMDLSSNKYVHSSVNRTQKLAGASSFTVKGQLSSVDDAMTPVIDLNAIGVALITNKINSPALTDIDTDIDGEAVVVGSSNVSFDSTTNVITVASTTDFNKIKIGARIVISDAGGSNDTKAGYISAIDTTTYKLTFVGDALVTQAGRSATLTQYVSYVDEVANGGTAESKTLTKVVSLDKECTGFRVIVQMNIHTDAEVKMYYRTRLKASDKSIADNNWTNYPITYKKETNEIEFTEYEYNLTDLPKFDEFQFKFVMLSSNTAVTPKLKNLRIIAHA